MDNLKMYTLTEICEIIGISHRTALTMVKDGRLTARKIAGKWRVTADDLNRYIESAETNKK